MKFNFIIIFFLISISSIFAQEQEFINGRLLAASNQSPVPFATISIKGKSIGVVSNQDGGFRIPSRFRNQGDTLTVSSLGFKTREILMSSLKVNYENIIHLTQEVQQLEEVVVAAKKSIRRRSTREIIRLAIERIPQNYPQHPFSYVGYYRDYQIKDSEYINLNEAIMEVFDQGFLFNDFENTQATIYQYKKNQDFRRDEVAAKPYDYKNKSKIITNAFLGNQGGNEYVLLRIHDAIRNYRNNTYSFVNRFNKDFQNNHEFSMGKEIVFDGKPIFIVNFKSIVHERIIAIGKLYIAKDNFAIYKMEYAVYEIRSSNTKQFLKLYSTNYDSPNRDLSNLIFEVITEYKSIDDKMYLNYISFDNVFLLLEDPKFYLESSELLFDEKSIKLSFNNAPLQKDALKKGNYKIYYNGKRIKLDEIRILDKTIILYLQNVSDIFNIGQDLKQIELELELEVKNIKDVYGDTINKSDYVQINQFREFFVQEIKPKNKIPQNTLFMKKNRPIYQGQRIVAPKNLSDYWMNTPLQKANN